jgi:ribosomal protein L40E
MSEDIIVCPVCNAENDALRKDCLNCGQSLIVVCPRCNTINPITAEQCFACSQHFDTFGHIMARHELRFEDRFTRQAATASGMKEEQRAQDKVRSNELWERERQRQEMLASQLVRRKAQERQLLIGAVVVVVLVVAVILISALIR